MDENKKKKIIWLAILVLFIAVIVVWLIVRSPKTDAYAYEGYIIDIRQTADGAVLTTLNAGGQSEFIVKHNTRKEFKGEAKTLQVGDYIQLDTKKKSQTDIKRFIAFSAYYTEGKIVNVEGESSPILITTNTTIGTSRIYKLQPAEGAFPAMVTGTPVKVYHQYELSSTAPQIVSEVIQPLSDTPIPLTDRECEYIGYMDYTLVGAKEE